MAAVRGGIPSSKKWEIKAEIKAVGTYADINFCPCERIDEILHFTEGNDYVIASLSWSSAGSIASGRASANDSADDAAYSLAREGWEELKPFYSKCVPETQKHLKRKFAFTKTVKGKKYRIGLVRGDFSVYAIIQEI